MSTLVGRMWDNEIFICLYRDTNCSDLFFAFLILISKLSRIQIASWPHKPNKKPPKLNKHSHYNSRSLGVVNKVKWSDIIVTVPRLTSLQPEYFLKLQLQMWFLDLYCLIALLFYCRLNNTLSVPCHITTDEHSFYYTSKEPSCTIQNSCSWVTMPTWLPRWSRDHDDMPSRVTWSAEHGCLEILWLYVTAK